MNHRFFLWILVLLITVQQGWAVPEAQNTLIYTIVTDSTIVEHRIIFTEEQLNWSIPIPYDSEAVELKNASFDLIDAEEYKIISAESIKEVNLKYISDGFVEKTKDRYFTINLATIPGSKNITVILPESASLKYSLDSPKSSLVPATKDVTTDGKRMIIHWSNEELANANSLLVIYDEPTQEKMFWLLPLSIFIAFLVIGYVLLQRKPKTKSAKAQPAVIDSSKDITRNLFEEEKAIVETLLKAKGNELWQKQLLFETGISKVKLSRKLRALEYKGLIEKIPFGNTNKIRLKR